jgi:hypothetical protein
VTSKNYEALDYTILSGFLLIFAFYAQILFSASCMKIYYIYLSVYVCGYTHTHTHTHMHMHTNILLIPFYSFNLISVEIKIAFVTIVPLKNSNVCAHAVFKTLNVIFS